MLLDFQPVLTIIFHLRNIPDWFPETNLNSTVKPNSTK